MNSTDLFALRERFDRERIMLCFNGPISRNLIEEIGNALRNYLEAEHIQPSSAMDVFGTYIEMTQNIRHYAAARGYGEHEAAATVVVATREDGRHSVSAGNLVATADGQALVSRIESLGQLDKVQLKALYKEQLRMPRPAGSSSGSGLGLIDMARKASEPLMAHLHEVGDGQSFFSLRAVI
jgi:hypothetical protein